MINLNHKPIQGKHRIPTGLRLLFYVVVFLLIVLFIFSIYRVIRRTAVRFSADYYFPFLKIARFTEDTVADQTLMLQSKYTLAKALRTMMKENAMLAAGRAVVMDLKKENAELRSLLKLNRKDSFAPVFAEVLSRDPLTWQEQFMIDKGSRSGIEPGNPVVTATLLNNGSVPGVAVIGIVKSVSGHTALVSTILSQDFRMSVSLPQTRTSGILEGARKVSDMKSVLRFLPLDLAPKAGHVVYTNAFSGNSPPGLPVGEIVSSGTINSEPSRNHIYAETWVRPFESPAEVRFIAVFIREKK